LIIDMEKETQNANNENEPAAIRVEALKKSYGQQSVLDGIDLEVKRGETLAIVGRSGTGKSVLLKLIIGLQKPDAGSIQVEGEDVNALNLDQLNQIRKRMGFLFQNAALYDSLTVEENVAFPLRRHSNLEAPEVEKRVEELLARVGMEKDLKKMPADISGGMKKRVGLARSLALDPEIILLDEPTAGLDPITAGEIIELIEKMQQEGNVTVLLVTHDMHSVEALSDQVALLDNGIIKAKGSLEEVRKSEDPFVKEFLRESA